MLLDYYVLSSATMPPRKTSAVVRRSTRVAVKKQFAASVSVKESAPTTSAVGGHRKATKSVSIAEVGNASRAGKTSTKGP